MLMAWKLELQTLGRPEYTPPRQILTTSSIDAEGPRDAPQIRNITLEKACNRRMTFRIITVFDVCEYHFLIVATVDCCYISIPMKDDIVVEKLDRN